MAGAHVLVVEDDEVIGRSLKEALGGEGHEVDWVAAGSAAIDAVEAGPVDLVLLDLGLPDTSGLEVCRRLRELRPKLAILVLTARSEEVEIVVGLDAGADDYITKPFRLAELMARTRAHLRRLGAGMPAGKLVSGELCVDPSARRAWLGESEVALRPREFDLLVLLLSEAGRAVRRERIVDEVWDRNWYKSTKTLDMHISALRRKLGDPRLWGGITTLRGIGYRFEVP